MLFVSFVVALAIAILTRQSFKIERHNWGKLTIRSIFGTIGFTSMVFAVKYLPLGIHMIIFNTAPF